MSPSVTRSAVDAGSASQGSNQSTDTRVMECHCFAVGKSNNGGQSRPIGRRKNPHPLLSCDGASAWQRTIASVAHGCYKYILIAIFKDPPTTRPRKTGTMLRHQPGDRKRLLALPRSCTEFFETFHSLVLPKRGSSRRTRSYIP